MTRWSSGAHYHYQVFAILSPNYSFLINSNTCVSSATELCYSYLKETSPQCPDRGSSFAPVEGNIYDTLSTGNRPVYNSTSRNGGINPCILNLVIRWRSKPHSAYFQGKKNAKYLLKRRLGGAHSQSGQFGEEKYLLCLLALHPEATSLYCLHVKTLP
jgi:hypothetical protein